jgi:hypothetical protein
LSFVFLLGSLFSVLLFAGLETTQYFRDRPAGILGFLLNQPDPFGVPEFRGLQAEYALFAEILGHDADGLVCFMVTSTKLTGSFPDFLVASEPNYLLECACVLQLISAPMRPLNRPSALLQRAARPACGIS